MNQESSQKGYYINGKKQAIELLQHLDGNERQKLLKNISLRNASMAKELSEQIELLWSFWSLSSSFMTLQMI